MIPDADHPIPSQLDIDTYIRRSDALDTLIKSMDDAALASDVAAGAGHVFTVLVGGLVLWQLNTEGAPTAPDKILGASRDLGTAAASMVQLGTLAVKWFAEDRWSLAWVIEPVEAFGRFASKLSTFISLLANGMATVRYIAQGDWVGATLMFLATGASVVAFAATVGVVSAPVGAIAATVAAIFAVIDVVRLAIFPPAEQVRWEQIVGARQLLFARRVAIAAPCEGDLVLTQPLPPNQLVDATELGTIEVPPGGDDNSDAEHAFIDLAVGDGITAIYAITEAESAPVTVMCPIPALTSPTLLTDDRERFVNVGDTLLSVLPRFESWLLALDTVFDAVFVAAGQHVEDGEVVATLDGDQVRAPRAGTVIAFETLPDSERIRIRADPGSEVVVEG
jgi:hypothetical protein